MVFFLLGKISLESFVYAKNEYPNKSMDTTQYSRHSSRFDYLYYQQHMRYLFSTIQQRGINNIGLDAETSNWKLIWSKNHSIEINEITIEFT